MSGRQTRPDLLELGETLASKGPVKTLPTPRRVRILFNGVYVVDTTSALYVWEHEFYPYFYVPYSSFLPGLLTKGNTGGDRDVYWQPELRSGSRTTNRVLCFGPESVLGEHAKALANMVRVEFGAADAWFEEDVQIYVHPKDPFRRVDVLFSTRPVKVRVKGRLVAEAAASYHLHETGLPCRYYLPATSVDRAVLKESETTTACPYKGVASYYDVGFEGGDGQKERFEDLVWYYRTPTLESENIAGCLCFYHEKEGVEIELDGKVLPRPETPWS
ncbi:DUF427-domain-containing protein [Hypoxylon rubiginosum]|uniref:DUF427-domain-containing protein n=1 Tax=Hypoxylon rubiginosum TaxID=110542 RepID=A0ACB9YX81_9PEZI|nr:DUF427-domain-containing protein [Hypoxylon rubiginosum]